MADLVVQARDEPLRGSVIAPPDRSVAEMCLFAAAWAAPGALSQVVAKGAMALPASIALQALGVPIAPTDTGVTVTGIGLEGFSPAKSPIECGASVVTLAGIAAVLCGAGLTGTLHAEPELARAHLHSIARVLRLRGARLEGQFLPETPQQLLTPLVVETAEPLAPLNGHPLPPASFAEKLAALMSGVFAHGDTVVAEPLVTHDAFPRVLRAAGVDVESAGGLTRIAPLASPLAPQRFVIPGDLDAALMLLAAALAHPNSQIGARGVIAQPSDAAALLSLRDAGASLHVEARATQAGQATADLTAFPHAPQRLLIEDERALAAGVSLATLAAWAAHARHDSCIRGVIVLPGEGERVARVLAHFAVPAHYDSATATLRITGHARPPAPSDHVRVIDPEGDGRAAMLATVLALRAGGTTRITAADCIVACFPRFVGSLRALGAHLSVSS